MKLATVRLRNKRTGKIVVVNQIDYATDLGKHQWQGYELAGDARGDKQTPQEEKAIQKEFIRNEEKIRVDQKADEPLVVPVEKEELPTEEPVAVEKPEESKEPDIAKPTSRRRGRQE